MIAQESGNRVNESISRAQSRPLRGTDTVDPGGASTSHVGHPQLPRLGQRRECAHDRLAIARRIPRPDRATSKRPPPSPVSRSVRHGLTRSPKFDAAIAHLREVLGEQAYESFARKGEAMTMAAIATDAYTTRSTRPEPHSNNYGEYMETLRVGAAFPDPPFNGMPDDGGLDIDLMTAIAGIARRDSRIRRLRGRGLQRHLRRAGLRDTTASPRAPPSRPNGSGRRVRPALSHLRAVAGRRHRRACRTSGPSTTSKG